MTRVRTFDRESTRKKLLTLILPVTVAVAIGCTSSPEQKKKEDFFTSGSPAADRRAEQSVPKADDTDKPDTKQEAQKKASEAALEKQTTLYERLGGTNGVQEVTA